MKSPRTSSQIEAKNVLSDWKEYSAAERGVQGYQAFRKLLRHETCSIAGLPNHHVNIAEARTLEKLRYTEVYENQHTSYQYLAHSYTKSSDTLWKIYNARQHCCSQQGGLPCHTGYVKLSPQCEQLCGIKWERSKIFPGKTIFVNASSNVCLKPRETFCHRTQTGQYKELLITAKHVI